MTETLVVAESISALTYVTEQTFDERSATTMTPFANLTRAVRAMIGMHIDVATQTRNMNIGIELVEEQLPEWAKISFPKKLEATKLKGMYEAAAVDNDTEMEELNPNTTDKKNRQREWVQYVQKLSLIILKRVLERPIPVKQEEHLMSAGVETMSSSEVKHMYKRIANAYLPTDQPTDEMTGTNEEQNKKAYEHDTAITMRLTKDEATIQQWIEDNEEKKKRTLDEQDVDDQQAVAERRVLQIRSRRTAEGGGIPVNVKGQVINEGGKTILTTAAIKLKMNKNLRTVQKAAGKLGIQGSRYPTDEEVATVRRLMRIEKEVNKGGDENQATAWDIVLEADHMGQEDLNQRRQLLKTVLENKNLQVNVHLVTAQEREQKREAEANRNKRANTGYGCGGYGAGYGTGYGASSSSSSSYTPRGGIGSTPQYDRWSGNRQVSMYMSTTTHTHAHRHMHMHTQTRTHTRAHTHTHMNTQPRTHTYKHMRITTNTRTHTHTHTHEHNFALTHTRAHAHIHTRTYTCTHASEHTQA